MPPLSRIFRDGGPKVRWWDQGPFEVSLARGEVEHLQFAVVPVRGSLESVEVLATSFTSPGTEEELQVTVGPVGFVRTPRWPQPRPEVEVGDVLLPSTSFTVADDELGAAYLLLEASPQTPAGRYSGEVRIEPEGRPPKVISIRVNVWDFALPPQPPLHGWCSTLAADLLLKHKLEPGWWNPPFDLDDPVTDAEWAAARESVRNWFDAGHSFMMIRTPGGRGHGSCVGGAGNSPMPDYTPEQVQAMITYWRGMARIIDGIGRLDAAAVYVWDEPHYEKFGQMATICDWVHEAHPRLKTCAAGWWDLRSWRDNGAIDIYCPVSFSFNAALDRTGHPSGTEAWWYVCYIPPAPAPNVMVDNDPQQQRIIGWQSWRFGVTGFIYWETMRAHWDGSPEYDPPSADCGSMNDGGDGTLIYLIGGKWVASLRLRHLADGMEDLQYIRLLERLLVECDEAGLDPTSTEWREARIAARRALGRASKVTYADYSNSTRLVEAYTKDPNELLSARSDIAQAIMTLEELLSDG